jgi:hypothetical protein
MLLLQKCKETADARLISVYSGYAALFPTRQENFSSLWTPRVRQLGTLYRPEALVMGRAERKKMLPSLNAYPTMTAFQWTGVTR